MIRAEHGIGRSRFCGLLGVPRATYYRRLGRAADHGKGPWPAPVLDRIGPQVRETAEAFPAWGHRKIWALLGYDGIHTSPSSVERSLRRDGLLLPARYQRERRALAVARRAAFVEPPRRRNRIWQLDFAEFETQAGGVWQIAAVVDYWAKLCLCSVATTTKTTHDAVAALRAASVEAARLLGLPDLAADCLGPDELLEPTVVVTDNGPCFKSGGFAAHIARHQHLGHVRTRHRSPESNGVVERYIGSIKYERLYREQIRDGLDLQAQLDDYRDLYNRVRPHEAIAWARPHDVYLAAPTVKEPNLETA